MLFRNESVMKRAISRLSLIISIIAVSVVIGLVATGWWYLTQGQFPLAGSYRHEFGLLPWGEQYAMGTHTFVLQNRTGETVVIEALRGSCGCVQVTESTNTVEPDETVHIEVVLKLGKPGPREEHVKLVLADGTVQILWVYARAEGQSPYDAEQQRLNREAGIILGPGGIPLERIDDEEDTRPRIIVPKKDDENEEEPPL